MKSQPLLSILKKACAGLLFPSETDAKLEPFIWKQKEEPTPALLVEAAGGEAGMPVETLALPAFFRAVPKEAKSKFDLLAKLLKEHLADIKVYKIGEVNLQVYILGKTKDGQWAGLKTEVVET